MKKILNLIFAPIRFIRRRWKLMLVLLIIAGLIGAWQWQQYQKKQPVLSFTKPETKELVKTLQVSGLVDAEQKANLRFAAGGKLVSLPVQEGEVVKKGQTIAVIDRQELQKRLQQDLNSYMRERWDWETSQDATDYNVETLSTRRSLDKQQWDLNDTVLDVEIRDIAIRNTVLSAPFAGMLVRLPATVVGVTLAATDVFELVDPNTLVFKALVDEADIANVQVGQTAMITLDAFPDNPLKTYVASIDYKSSETSSGTVFIVKLPLAEYSSVWPIRLGMNGDATITLETRENVLSIPLDTTRQRDDKIIVDVRTGEKTSEERVIKTGLETDDDIEVLEGLSPSDEIVVPETNTK